MKRLYINKKRGIARDFVVPGIVFFLLIIFMIQGASYFNYLSDRQNLDLTRQAVKRAAVQCYSIEGNYPADVEYLEKNYGVVINHDKFFVDYMSIASNIMPNIEVYDRY